MNKKFKFKLDGLLKMRSFKEKMIKADLGKIVKKQTEIREKIESLKKDILEIYKAQKEAFDNGNVDGRMLQFYPQFISQKKAHIVEITKLLSQSEIEYSEKVKELKVAMGEVKVVENMKERKKKEFKKKLDKKMQEELEDIINLRRKLAKGS